MSSFIIKAYKSTIAFRYIPVDAEQIGSKIMESEYYLTSVKYDGHLTFLSVDNGITTLYNSSGQTLHIPSILEV